MYHCFLKELNNVIDIFIILGISIREYRRLAKADNAPV